MLYINPEDHFASRIAVHPSQRQPHIEPISQPLHVACAISNPERYASRYKLYSAFAKHMYESGVKLYTVELAYRDRHHEIRQTTETKLIQLRSSHQLWHKENLLNVAVSNFEHDWNYGAYIDGDFLFTRPDWVTETIHQLQHFSWVQMFSSYIDLDYKGNFIRNMNSFADIFLNGRDIFAPGYAGALIGPRFGATGAAWAFRRGAFDTCGGFLETCILGSGDWHMSFALAKKLPNSAETREGSTGLKRSINQWATRAAKLNANIGCVDGTAIHYWHGSKVNRFYGSRWKILKDHDYDPETDIQKDWQGVLMFTGNKPAMERDIMNYFRSRNEDELS